jgi:hypothetical protein
MLVRPALAWQYEYTQKQLLVVLEPVVWCCPRKISYWQAH